ncbi:MAG: sulfur-oxidizing protein SoxX [Gammaproteobacteria bacterium]|jgi:sulfur-oxidizing protein SoxX
MRRLKKTFTAFGVSALMIVGAGAVNTAAAETYPADKNCKKIENPTMAQTGWCLAINRRKGNCLGCHTILVNPWPEGFAPGGNVAPPLVAMKARFPERHKLYGQIYDATALNPNSKMPPFGKHKLLSEGEIDAIVEFLLTI